MIKKKVFHVTVLFSFFLVFNAFAADVAKLGVIDFQKILKVSDSGKEALGKVNKQGKKMEADLTEKKKGIEDLQKRLEREALVMSKEMRDEKGRELRIKINDFKVLEKKYQSELFALEKKHVLGFKEDVFGIVEQIGKKEGYLMIIEKSSVVYYPNAIDITDTVIEKYNAKTKKN